MYKKMLWNSLSSSLRRPLSSTHRLSQNQSSPIYTPMFCPSLENKSYPTGCSYIVFKDPRISSKFRYSTECVEKVDVRCWNCRSAAATSPFLFCESCRSVQPVDQSVDYFQIFGLEKMYKFDDKNLEGKYKDWQKKLHPDLVHSKSEQEKEYAADQSARVIDAYRTLKKSLSRAIYILNLEGITVDEEQTISDPELLAEILEIRESVEEAADSQELKKIQTQIQEQLKHWSESFANAFQSQNFEEAKTSIQRMTYYERVNEEILKKL